MRAIADTKTAEANLHSWLGGKQLGQQTKRLIGALAVGISLSIKAEAASFNFTQIAESSTNFGSFSITSLNDRGTVALRAIAPSNFLLQKLPNS